MKRRKFKAQVKRVKAVLDKWLAPLGLKWFLIDVLYYGRGEEFPKGSLVLARVVADWRYMTAQVRINAPLAAEYNDERLERMVVHELIHVILQEMQDTPGDQGHLERVVEMLTNAFRWVRQAGADDQSSRAGVSR